MSEPSSETLNLNESLKRSTEGSSMIGIQIDVSKNG